MSTYDVTLTITIEAKNEAQAIGLVSETITGLRPFDVDVYYDKVSKVKV